MRLTKLRSTLADQDLDAILVGQADNRRYLSGFTGSSGWLLITAERALLATDFRYYEQVERQAPDFELAKIKARLSAELPDLLADLSVQRLGFESQHLSVDELHTLSESTGDVEWVPLKETVETLRATKDQAEIEALRRSAALNDAAFAHLVEIIRPGMTELEVAWQIESYLRTHGASKVAFDIIVAAGPNGALPHARPSDHPIQPGEPVVIDMGCILDGYCSDMTRTICLDEPPPTYLKVWNLVLEAQEAALAGIRAGLTGREADALARDPIQAAGYGEQFGHGLGHGVGLAVHEMPRASFLSEDTLATNMSLTVEPGIYLPGEFGVRIEDLVIVEAEDIQNLTATPKIAVISR
ncbi:MAG: Xaa-Pro peptidase family protein [Anaerolineae bacterium]|jgi:Xaa-Pro aminopeptidase